MLDLQVGEPSCSVSPVILPFFVFNEFSYQERLNTLAIGNLLFVTYHRNQQACVHTQGNLPGVPFCIAFLYGTSQVLYISNERGSLCDFLRLSILQLNPLVFNMVGPLHKYRPGLGSLCLGGDCCLHLLLPCPLSAFW